MKAHYNIIQRTPEWYQIRWGKIGGTRSSQLFTKGDALLVDLVAEQTETFEVDEDGFISADMMRGIELESEAIRQLSEYIGTELHGCGWIESTEFPIAGISPDGLSKCETIGAEIKCPARKKHTRTILEGEIPLDDIDQCIHFFTVNDKLKELYYCSFRPESVKPLFVHKLTLDSLINFGTKAKPVMKKVSEAVEVAKIELKSITELVESKIESLNF